MSDTPFGLRIHALRLFHGWSQGQLAAKASLHEVTINGFECGRVKPSARALRKLALAFGITVEELMRGLK